MAWTGTEMEFRAKPSPDCEPRRELNSLSLIGPGCEAVHESFGRGVVLEYQPPAEVLVRFDDDEVGDRRLHLGFAPLVLSRDGVEIDFLGALPDEELEVIDLSQQEEDLARLRQVAAGDVAVARKAMGVATDEEPVNLAGLHLYGLDASGRRLISADFSKAYLRMAVFAGAVLTEAVFVEADMESADLSGCELGGADFSGAVLTDAEFRGANLTNANLAGIFASLVGFADANLAGAHLTGASLIAADFTGANLEGANLLGAEVDEADFSGARLTGATMPDGSTHG